MKRQWKFVPEYDNQYLVSNFGEIYTKKRDRLLSPCFNSKGYLFVTLSKPNERSKSKLVHRLVAEAFLGKKEHKQVNHINENKTDNNLSNLEWLTCKENIRHGTGIARRMEKVSKPVRCYCFKTGLFVSEYKSMSEASRNGFSLALISMCCRGLRNKHKNLIWVHVDKKGAKID